MAEVDLFEINVEYAKCLFGSVRDGDWKNLERLAAYEIGCIPGFEVEQQKRGRSSVFDAFVRIKGQYVDFRRELGSYLLAECKNWKDPVGSEAMAYFAQNLSFHNCAAGIMFSSKGITGAGLNEYAALTLLRAFHHSGRIILVLGEDDFGKAADGEPLQEILRRRYEEVRFDLRPQ